MMAINVSPSIFTPYGGTAPLNIGGRPEPE
jgi:hypothetical protein